MNEREGSLHKKGAMKFEKGRSQLAARVLYVNCGVQLRQSSNLKKNQKSKIK